MIGSIGDFWKLVIAGLVLGMNTVSMRPCVLLIAAIKLMGKLGGGSLIAVMRLDVKLIVVAVELKLGYGCAR